jgi:phosphoenolpyruvate carboxykinase (ATP)
LKTGRSPKDKRVVKNAASENDIWWGAVNIPLDPRTFDINRQRAQDYLNTRERLYCFDGFAGEMKKGVFTVANYFAPKRGVLSMHCSATADKETGRSSLLFGLSGTGKTTLSADPKRHLIGDDEHCWSDDGIFNIEGGCYAKAINLTPENEPDIFQALRFGAVLENVVLDDDQHVDFTDTSITENTRGAYPIEFIQNAKIPCTAGHPTDVIFLTCDTFGVLPPVSSLSPAHAMYHFISGYTAKVAGTEMGVTEPQATFSPCFGGPFLVWHPSKYAELLAAKMREHGSRVWLVNTGWSGGAYGAGKRMKLANTRAIVDAIHSGALAGAKTVRDPVFGFNVATECPGVPGEILLPRGELGRPGRLRCHGAEAGRSFQKELCDLRRRRRRRGEGGRAKRMTRIEPKRSRRKSRTASTIPDIGWKFLDPAA